MMPDLPSPIAGPSTHRATVAWVAVIAAITLPVIAWVWPASSLYAVGLLSMCAWAAAWSVLSSNKVDISSNSDGLSATDPLTGLLGRQAITDRLKQCIDHHPDNSRAVVLLFLDFDRFKLVNDAMGHDAGDELLKQIAERIQDTLAEHTPADAEDCHIGRLGGDEFVIIFEGVADRKVIDEVLKELHQALHGTYPIAGRAVHSSASIGITTTEHGYASADHMLRDADTAMYEAKRTGRAKSVWFDQHMHDAVRDAIELENDLRHAIERDELFLVYQPIINLEDGSVTGFESLIRWRHPERGLVRPDEFIHIAEESMLIRPIGRWIIREALEQTKAWRDRFPELANMVMNVNLSRVQFADFGLTRYIIDTLGELGLPHDVLCLEITESTIMEDGTNAIELLHQLRDLGFKLAMDDFGTGYSSLSHLHEFPLDALKIDKSFIEHLGDNMDYAAVINAITTLAGNLGFTVVAEGLETADQVAHLQALSCHKGQGFYFHKPAEPKVIEAYLSQREQAAREDAQTA